jgi:hypothetical protein
MGGNAFAPHRTVRYQTRSNSQTPGPEYALAFVSVYTFGQPTGLQKNLMNRRRIWIQG